MAITRRQFLQRTGLITAGSLLGPSFFRNPFLRRALADTVGDRYFMVVYLGGGNDGLNTVTPIADGSTGALRTAYEQARKLGGGGLRLLAGHLGGTQIGNDPNSGTPLALHPGLVGLKHLYDRNNVAVIQGCGYPEYNLSHEASRIIWQTANPLSVSTVMNGWMGRYLAANYTGNDIPGVCILDAVPTDFFQTTTSVLAVSQLDDFGFPYDDYDPTGDNEAFKRQAFLDLCAQARANAQPVMQYLGQSGVTTLDASESYPTASGLYESDRAGFSQAYDDLDTSFATDLKEVAKVIYGVKIGAANVHARFFEVENDGYDTHSDQGADGPQDQHYLLHRALGDGLEALYNDLSDMGVWNKVCIVVFSEFSRRIEQNASGTDHGSQGPVFVIGGGVQGGVYGNHADINITDDDGNTSYSQVPDDPYRSTDFRDVYGTILGKWLGMASPQDVLPVDTGDPAAYWTAPNFNMGFL